MSTKSHNQEYDEYRVKVPRKDKNGNDITGDKIGKGGRHRADGTYSGVAYDFVPIESCGECCKTREELMSDIETLSKEMDEREYPSFTDTVDNVLYLVNQLCSFAEEHPEIIIAISSATQKVIKKIEAKIARAKSAIKNKWRKEEKTEEIFDLTDQIEELEVNDGEVDYAIVISKEMEETEVIEELVDMDDYTEMTTEETSQFVTACLVYHILLQDNNNMMYKAF